MSELVELVLEARTAVLPGGLGVRRALPQRQRRMVGPFVFVDPMGPAKFPPDAGADVLAHPHIGLATLTWLFSGEGLHKDSLGCVQSLRPGEVNRMIAGKGIVHAKFMRGGSEGRLYGVQTWVALPRADEKCEPSFTHYGREAVPELEEKGMCMKVVAGSLLGARSRVRVASPLFYVEARMQVGSQLVLPAEYEERAAYLVEGSVELHDRVLAAGELAFFAPRRDVRLRAGEPSLLLLLEGEPLDGPRHIDWNFVSSSRERLRQAADDWRPRETHHPCRAARARKKGGGAAGPPPPREFALSARAGSAGGQRLMVPPERTRSPGPP